jgi:hypothetical protein
MSEALERVIAEQQKEIDRLRLMEKNSIERWQHENKAVERMAERRKERTWKLW